MGAGNVGDVLRMISRLQYLTTLDFTNQFLTGSLPSDVSFPALEVLQLANNYITVRSVPTTRTPLAHRVWGTMLLHPCQSLPCPKPLPSTCNCEAAFALRELQMSA